VNADSTGREQAGLAADLRPSLTGIMPIETIDRAMLKAHARAIVHMRDRLRDDRLGLILGAGVSKTVGFPTWSELVTRIAKNPRVLGEHLLEGVGSSVSDTAKTQMLLQHYRTKRLDALGELSSARVLRKITGEWRRIVQEALYEGVPQSAQKLKDAHPYLRHFIPIVTKSPMTVTYNFDDMVERLIRLERPEREKAYGRSFETVWNSSLQPRPGSVVIYHPNGYLPQNLLENPSDSLVFSEETFADQLIESMAGHHASLLHHLSNTTCLLIGLSLADATLRHLLRQSARINPGQYHYHITFLGEDKRRDPVAEDAVRQTNFEVYNLITLFMTNSEIASLGRLLNAEDSEFRHVAEEEGVELRFVYYLSGAIGAGKTTVLSYLGSLRTYEEWTEARNELLAKAWPDLTADERIEVDDWIMGQFAKKNVALLDRSEGLLVVDRPPLDPLSFSDESDVAGKSRKMQGAFAPGFSKRKVCMGSVILLTGEPSELEARVIGRNKESSAPIISDLQAKLQRIYPEHRVVNTHGASVHEVVHAVSKIVFLEPYKPCDLAKVLEKLGREGLPGSDDER